MVVYGKMLLFIVDYEQDSEQPIGTQFDTCIMKTKLPLLVAVLFVVLLGMGCASPISGPPVLDGWGTVIDKDGDCAVKAEKGKLTISVPATLHDLSNRNPDARFNAPRVMQDVEGDFVVQVRVTGEFDPGKTSTAPKTHSPFISAGFLIWADEKNYLRLERNVWWSADLGKHVCYPPLLEHFKDGVYQETNPPPTAEPFFEGNSTWFRLERKGDKVLTAYSHDGKEWVSVKELAAELPKKLSVGVLAINTSTRAFKVEFDEFKLDRK